MQYILYCRLLARRGGAFNHKTMQRSPSTFSCRRHLHLYMIFFLHTLLSSNIQSIPSKCYHNQHKAHKSFLLRKKKKHLPLLLKKKMLHLLLSNFCVLQFTSQLIFPRLFSTSFPHSYMNNIAIMDRHIINHPDIIRVWFIIVIFLAD